MKHKLDYKGIIDKFEHKMEYHYIETVGGDKLDYNNIDTFSPSIGSIAVGLANTCRFSGQIEDYFSVAQHSILVYNLVTEQGGSLTERMQSLLHDSSEAFMTDIASPLKDLLPAYLVIEKRVSEQIGKVLGVNLIDLPKIVKEADSMALHLEAQKLGLERDWIDTSIEYNRGIVGVSDPNGKLVTLPPAMVREHFLSVYWNLKLKIDKENERSS